jgi:hypothetical protein
LEASPGIEPGCKDLQPDPRDFSKPLKPKENRKNPLESYGYSRFFVAFELVSRQHMAPNGRSQP